MGVSRVSDIRESGPTGYPGYLRDIRDIRNHWQDQGWGYQVTGRRVLHTCSVAERLLQRANLKSPSRFGIVTVRVNLRQPILDDKLDPLGWPPCPTCIYY